MHVQYSICVCILSSLDKTTMGKTVPSEILEPIAPHKITQVLCAALQQLIFNYTIMMIIMCSRKCPLYSWCIMAVILKYATIQQAVYPVQPNAPDHTDLSDVSTIKELISLYFPSDNLSAKVTSIDGAFPRETD